MKNVNELINKLVCEAISGQDGLKEYVPMKTMYKAKDIVDNVIPATTEDALLYAVSLNLLNTYVKQSTNQEITYYFKENVMNTLVNSIIQNDIKDITYDLTRDRGMSICYVKINNIVFSFHQVRIPKERYNYFYESSKRDKIVFDNIRKQKCARTLFETTYNTLKEGRAC